MSEGVALRERWRSRRAPGRQPWIPVSELEFPGCEAHPMTPAEYEAYEGRVEFYDSASGLAWMARDAPGFGHEVPRMTLSEVVKEISQFRGSPIKCYGAAELRLLNAETGERQSLHPDQIVYLRLDFQKPKDWTFLRVGEGPIPDVVLEVDHTTDVRKSRLALYEEWEFPEVWVEVPDAYTPSRPRSRKSGLEIHLLEGRRFVRSPVSRAFPGWQARDIHRALNEGVVSAKTSAVLERVGRAIGRPEGTGPDDDALLGRFGRERQEIGRIEGQAEGRVEGHAQGRVEGRAEMVRELLRSQGIELSARFPEDLGPRDRAALRRASARTVLVAASAARSLADFLARLRRRDP